MHRGPARRERGPGTRGWSWTPTLNWEQTMKTNRIIIFDTTLRDGEQCPGASMNLREKIEVARQLARLKVDVIEAGRSDYRPGDQRTAHSRSSAVCGQRH